MKDRVGDLVEAAPFLDGDLLHAVRVGIWEDLLVCPYHCTGIELAVHEHLRDGGPCVGAFAVGLHVGVVVAGGAEDVPHWLWLFAGEDWHWGDGGVVI